MIKVSADKIFYLTVVVTVIALLASWYYFSQDYALESESNSRGEYIEFRISDVGFGAGRSFITEAFLHPQEGEVIALGPVAKLGNRKMVATFVDSGKWLDDQHFQARLVNLRMDITQNEEGWQLDKELEQPGQKP